MSKVWYNAEAFDRTSYDREIEKQLLREELAPLKQEKRQIESKLNEIRKKWNWEDYIPTIRKLNNRKKEIETEIEQIYERFDPVV